MIGIRKLSGVQFQDSIGLPVTQKCAKNVESAAKHNLTRPDLSTDHLNITNPLLDILRNFANVQIILLDNQKYLKGSPFEEWYEKAMAAIKCLACPIISGICVFIQKWWWPLHGFGFVLKPLDENAVHNVLFVEGFGYLSSSALRTETLANK